MADDLENMIFRCIDRYMAGRHSKRYGVVTSWDPVNHLAKVTYQPEGQESGWLQVQTMAAGNGYGHMSGLSVGDQVEITHQEGEFETGAITSRVHSTQATPPTVQSGEELIQTPWGQKLLLAKDGSSTITDQSGATLKFDGSGNITISNAASITMNASGAVKINSSSLQHNNLEVGATHVHGGVTAGAANTGVPNP